MVQCDICHKWFHIKCVGILTLPNTDDKWCCSSCVCVTEILIYCFIEPYPAFLVKLICIRAFDDHFIIRSCMTTRSLIKRNGFIVGWGEGGTHSAVEGQNPLADCVSSRAESASRLCPLGQNPIADCVRGDTIWKRGGGGGGGCYDTGRNESLLILVMKTSFIRESCWYI